MADDTEDRILNHYDYEDPQRDLTRSRPQGNLMHDPHAEGRLPDIGWAERRQRADKAAKGPFDDITHDTRRWMDDSATLASLGLSKYIPAAYEAYYDTAHPVTRSEQSTGNAALLLGMGAATAAGGPLMAKYAPFLAEGAPGGIRAGRTGMAAQIGAPGWRSRMPELLDAEVTGYDAARRAYTEAINQYPTRFNQRLRLRQEMGPPAPMERGMRDPNGRAVRSRAGQDLIRMQREFPPPTAPTRPPWAENSMAETRAFPRRNNAPNQSPNADAEIDRMLGVINQSKAIPTGVAGTVLGGGAAMTYDPESRKLLGERQDHRFDKPMKVGPNPSKRQQDDEALKELKEWGGHGPPAPKNEQERWRLDEFPEARNYNHRMRTDRLGRNILASTAPALGIASAATMPLIRHVNPWLTGIGGMTDDPLMIALGMGPALVPFGLGAAAVGSGVLANESNKHRKKMKGMLDANYRRDRPPMSQEATTDDWTGPVRNLPYSDEGDLAPPPPKGRGRTGSW